jgi:hypothetical protein
MYRDPTQSDLVKLGEVIAYLDCAQGLLNLCKTWEDTSSDQFRSLVTAIKFADSIDSSERHMELTPEEELAAHNLKPNFAPVSLESSGHDAIFPVE